MYELVYDSAAMAPIEKRWPDAVITDASDFIHEGRFEVEVNMSEEEFYVYAMLEGFALQCLGLQLRMHRKESYEEVSRWISIARIAKKTDEDNHAD